MLNPILSLLLSGGLVLFFRFLNKKHKPPILGIYQQANKTYWIKFIVMYIFLRVKQLINYLKRLLAVERGESDDGTVHVHSYDANLEEKYNLGEYSKSIDGVYFNGMTKHGDAIICGLARRPNNVCDAFLYLKVKGQDLLLSPSLPDTHLDQSRSEQNQYSVRGISVNNFIPMRTWVVSYKGEMKPRNDPDKRVKVETHLTWSANFGPFEYNTHMSPRSVADDLAREQWSSDYFKLVKQLHQTHYEQMGFITGSVSIDGKAYEVNMPCVRDRSFGPLREWKNFHRYVYHFIFLENGDCMAVGSVSQPTIMSHLTIGYFCRKSDQAVLPIDSSDFYLYQHGEHQILPKDYAFTFKAGGESYVVQVLVNDEDTFYIGKERESKFYERWSSVEVNGVKGCACVEWQYNNVNTQKLNTK
ncbi:uncharacterized protein [Epargyreus clarus]|uniref:uncharacterized protein n=1 Tax=Epargyreus clarus TaxID=520877 RepID=UPI003C302924